MSHSENCHLSSEICTRNYTAYGLGDKGQDTSDESFQGETLFAGRCDKVLDDVMNWFEKNHIHRGDPLDLKQENAGKVKLELRKTRSNELAAPSLMQRRLGTTLRLRL
jgi:hypothetical protein